MILGHERAILVKIKESIAKNLIIKFTPKIRSDNYINWSCETNFEEEFKFCNKALLSQKLFEQKIVYKKRKQTQKADEESRALTDMLGLDSTYEEIKARHILVKTKEEAEIIITDLANGADFTEIAKRKSIGESSSKGGSLGWFRAEHQVYNFAKAVDSMIKGSHAPISGTRVIAG